MVINRVQELITYFEDIARHPSKAVQAEMARTGKKAVGCFPLYTPEEIVYAAGMLPVGMWGGQTNNKLSDKYLQSFCCSIMRANMDQSMAGAYDFLSAVIIPAYCDTLKCIMENWKVAVPQVRMIGTVYPQNRRIAAGKAYMVAEYQRIQKELEEVAGKTVTEQDLSDSLALYEHYRKTMLKFTELVNQYPITLNATVRHLVIKAAYFTDKKLYTEKVEELMAELQKLPQEDFRGLKVIVTGILTEPEAFLDVFVENDIAFAADDLAHESRQFRTGELKGSTTLEKLAEQTANRQCALLYDEEKSRGQMLIDMVREHKADGVVVAMMKFCDPEEFDYPIYSKELEAAGIPMLYLEIEQKMDSMEQIRTRVQGFAEMLATV